ncbi:hypothetical protein, partial [Ruthenibacterium lactatiformans]|uniref:hypothetical protein n=1 Tax=Ruthenibacterium lactatiformans TaxID=1550024 RepID=UPI003A90EC58
MSKRWICTVLHRIWSEADKTARAAGKGRGPQFLYTKQKALLGGSAFCIEGWESINKFGVIKFSSFSILLLLYLSKEESGKILNKNIY